MNQQPLPHLYKEQPDLELPAQFLPSEIYAQAIESFVIVCADTLFINPERRTFYLAKRRAKPEANWYMFGGRLKRGEGEIEAAQRNALRETGLDLNANRFTFWNLRRFWWKDRQQEPQDRGVDTLIYLFTVVPTEAELAAIKLDPHEYEADLGVREFTRADLIAQSTHPVLLEVYDSLFTNRSDHPAAD